MEGYFVEKILVYYRKHGVMTEIRLMKDMVKNLPNDIESIISVVQNIFIHQHWAKRYGIELDDRRKEEPCLRSIEEKLMFLNRSGYSHVMDKRPIENKMIAICRDFTVMAVALCREVGIPARARCGFATYFEKDKYVDHWVLEYWNEAEKRWILADPQIDSFQKEQLNISFNTLDITDKYFITGPKAWIMYREGKIDPELFGIFNIWGYEYLKCNLILNANSLLKMPMQPWDMWEGYKMIPVSEWNEQDYIFMDMLAEYALHVDDAFDELYSFVYQNDKIKVPEDLYKVKNFFELVG